MEEFDDNINEYNFGLMRQYTKKLSLGFTNAGNPVNLSSFAITSEIWNLERSKQYGSFSVNVTDPTNGKLELSLTKAQTTNLPDLVMYDIKANTGSEEKALLKGKISVKNGATT